MKIIKIVVIVFLFLIALLLGAENQNLVSFNYLIAKSNIYLSWLLGMAFVCGFVISWVIFGSLHLKARFNARRMSKKLKKYESSSDNRA